MTSLDHELDRLYQLPREEFVQARNDLAASLKKSGDADAASRVRGLSKPSASAWAINQLYWTARSYLDDVIAASDRYRRAQRAALAGDGSELADAERERRRAIEEAVRRVRFILAERESGAERASEGPKGMMRRIQTTLDALASYGSENPNPFRGRLSEDLDAPGFGALSSLAPPPAAAFGNVTAKETRKEEEALASARAALAKAMARAELQAAALDQARVALTRAREEANRAAAEVDEAKALVAELEEALRFRSTESGEAAG